MKKLYLLLVVFLLSIGMKAQNSGTIALNIYGGYTFSDRVELYNVYAQVEDGLEYGAGVEYFFTRNGGIELKYLRFDTKIPVYGYGVFNGQLNAEDDKGALSYVLFGGTSYFDAGHSVHPYIGGSLGVGIVESPRNGTDTNFGWEVRTGLKIDTGSLVTVNLQAYLQSMSAAIGDSYYYTYYGVVGVTDYANTYQFGLGVELGFNFK